MSLGRWLAVLAGLCLLGMPALAQPTVCTFTGAATDTNYTEYGPASATPGMAMVGGPPGGANAAYYRLAYQGASSSQWNIAFDQTDSNTVTGIQLDFDFSMGGSVGAGNYGDGLGVAFIPTSVYGTTGNGPSGGVFGDGNAAKDGSISIGLNLWYNGNGDDVGFDLNNNSISINYCSPTLVFHYVTDLGQFGYQSHQDNQGAAFDHLSATINIASTGGATVTVTLTSNQTGNKGDPPGNSPPTNRGGPGTSLAPGTSFTAINGLEIPAVMPYSMRLAFGARTQYSSDNHDITNVNCVFTP